MTKSASTRALYYTDPDGAGPLPPACDPLLAGRYLCDVIGNRLTLDARLFAGLRHAEQPHPAEPGQAPRVQQDFAGLGGDVRYLRTRLSAAKYWNVLGNFIFSLQAEGGYIHSFENGAAGIDPVRLTDRFFLGSPQIRGFDIRGVGPRIQRLRYTPTRRDPDAPMRDGPATVSGSTRIRRTSPTTRSAAGLIISPAPSSKSRLARACASLASGRASMSTSARCSACGGRT